MRKYTRFVNLRFRYVVIAAIICFWFVSGTISVASAQIQPTQTPTVAPVGIDSQASINLIRIIMNLFLGQGTNGSSSFWSALSNGTTNANNAAQPFISPYISSTAPSVNGQTYFQQCQSQYASYPLPYNCTICQAGCGPTSISMIVHSLVDASMDPIKMVQLYNAKNQYIGCNGSSYASATQILSSYPQLEVRTEAIDNSGRSATDTSYAGIPLAQYFQKYMDPALTGGHPWTILALANFCDAGCGHYFWVTNVDGNDNVWAFDPYYGIGQSLPYNENTRYPFPKYRYIILVRKKAS